MTNELKTILLSEKYQNDFFAQDLLSSDNEIDHEEHEELIPFVDEIKELQKEYKEIEDIIANYDRLNLINDQEVYIESTLDITVNIEFTIETDYFNYRKELNKTFELGESKFNYLIDEKINEIINEVKNEINNIEKRLYKIDN